LISQQAGFFMGNMVILMRKPLYVLAEFFSQPPGFYVMLAAALVCAAIARSSLGTYIVSIYLG